MAMSLRVQMPKISKEDVLRLLKSHWPFLALAVFGAVCVYPSWVSGSHVSARYAVKRREISDTQVRIARLPMYRRENVELGQRIADVEARLFEESELARLIGVLSPFARSSGVTILRSRPLSYSDLEGGPEGFDGRYVGQLLELTVEGGYHEVHRFIQKIEGHEKHMRLVSFSIAQQEEDHAKHLLNLVLVAFAPRSLNNE